jgi:predicted DNA-binding transcriptional regulator AlpA
MIKSIHSLPETGFLRIKQILGDPKANPPIPALLPISNSAFWDGIKKGLYPRPVKLSARTSAWRVEDIRALIERLSFEGGNHV